MILKFLALCFIHLQENIFASDDYEKHRQELAKKSLSRKKARCMAYYFNNQRIKKAEFIKKIKDSMSLKLELIQQQLIGNKFGNLTKNRGNLKENKQNLFVDDKDSDSSFDPIIPKAKRPYLRKGFSVDPESANHNQTEILNKLKIEKAEQESDLFETFNEVEQAELAKLDFLTRTYLYLRMYITNPIISCDEIDIKYAVKDFSEGALHCQNRIERIGKK